jgi:drug/metabolite transporter (DMT)-like permease
MSGKEKGYLLRGLGMLAGNRKKAVLLTVLAGFLWGTSFPAIKIGLQYMDAYTFAFLRFLVASLVMLSVLLLTKNFNFNFNKKRLILFLGVANGLAYLLQYIGMVFTTASKSSLFINLSAVWVALLSPLLLKERLGSKKILGVMVSLLGVLLMTTNLDFSSLSQGAVMGDLIVIGAGVIWAFFMVYNKPLVKESKNIVQSMAWLLFFTLLPLLLPASLSAGAFGSLPLDAWLAVFYTAVFCWVIPYYLWLKGLKYISPVTSSVVLLTEVIVAVAIATLALGEVLTVVSGIGALFIIIAILIVS